MIEEGKCAEHRDELAGWRCDDIACRKRLCGKCTAAVVNQYYCCLCGGTARRLVIARASRPFTRWLAKAIAYPVRTGLPMLGVIAVLLGIIAFTFAQIGDMDGWSAMLRGALVFVYVLVVADSAARGDAAERGAIFRLGRALAATSFVWIPALFYLWVGIPARGFAGDHMMWGFGVLALIYVPIAIAMAITDASVGDSANPFKLFELAWQLGRCYWVTVLTVAVLAVATVEVALATTAKIHAAIPAPVIGEVVASLPMLGVLAVLAYMIGLLPYVHGDRLGWADAPQYADPIHPKLVAQGKRKSAPVTEASAAAAEEAAASLAERNDARKISDAMKEDNLTRALKYYEARVVWSATSFDERQLLLLGKGAVRAKKLELAKRLFEDTIVRNGRQAGHALVGLAQLYAQQGDATQEQQLYRQVIELYPNSEAAKVAALKLNP